MKGPDGNDFTWGPVIETHTIGNIEIVEHWVKGRRDAPFAEKSFHLFVDKKDTHQASKTLQGAVVLGIAKANNLPASAAIYAAKLLDVPADY